MLFVLSDRQVLSFSDKYIYGSENGTWKLFKSYELTVNLQRGHGAKAA